MAGQMAGQMADEIDRALTWWQSPEQAWSALSDNNLK